MKIIRGITNFPNEIVQCVVTLGNFDGVHLGHQALFTRLKQVAENQNMPCVVIVFEPQPSEYFHLETAPTRLTSFQEKCSYFKEFGIDYCLVVSFNDSFAKLAATTFIDKWLIGRLHSQYVIIGDDFRFGTNRQGDASLFAQYASEGYFQFESMPTFVIDDQRVSSTAVRLALSNADFTLVNMLLGRDYTIWGKVVHGNALARELGFPTANIHLKRQKPALHGVYLVKVRHLGINKIYYGVANIGTRPTIEGKKAILEVHLFDFNDEIYGEYLEVTFIQKIRDEQKFTGLEQLKKQIEQDSFIAKQIRAELLNK